MRLGATSGGSARYRSAPLRAGTWFQYAGSQATRDCAQRPISISRQRKPEAAVSPRSTTASTTAGLRSHASGIPISTRGKWQHMRISRRAQFSVLGSTGYIGSELVRYLEEQGNSVATPRPDEWYKSDLGTVIYCVGVTSDFRCLRFPHVVRPLGSAHHEVSCNFGAVVKMVFQSVD